MRFVLAVALSVAVAAPAAAGYSQDDNATIHEPYSPYDVYFMDRLTNLILRTAQESMKAAYGDTDARALEMHGIRPDDLGQPGKEDAR